jgi:hypothetical protein
VARHEGQKHGHRGVQFKIGGGVALAPMSTTSERDVANSYACGRKGGLLIKYTTKGQSRGVLIDFHSLYPREVLFICFSHLLDL